MKDNLPKLRYSSFYEAWKETYLSDISRIYGRIGYRGYTIKDIVSSGEGAVSISPSNFVNNNLDFNKCTFISWKKYEESPEIKVEEGDILFVKTGSTYGKSAFVDRLEIKSTINPQLVIIKEIKINNRFLSYIILTKSIMSQVQKIVVGGAIPTITQKELSSMKFFLPSVPEQQKIASFLTSVDEKIKLLTKKKELLEQYKKGVMQKIFSQEIRFKDDNGNDFPDWVPDILNSLCTVNKSNLTANDIEKNPGDFKVYGAGGVFAKMNKYTHDEKYIGVVKDGSGVGNLIFCESQTSVTGTLDALKSKKSNNISFLYYLMLTINFNKYKVGSSIPHIYFKDYKKIKLKIPVIKEQKKIALFLSSLDKKIGLVDSQIDKTKEFKKGLLQQMFV